MPRPNRGAYLELRAEPGRRPVYVVTWYAGGRRRSRSTGTGDRAAAEQALAAHIVATRRVDRAPPSERLIADVLAGYGAERVPQVADPINPGRIIVTLADWWGSRTVAEITPQACREYATARKVSAGTVRRELGVLRAAIGHDHAAGRLGALVMVPLPQRPEPRERWLTRKEAAALLRAARNETRTVLRSGATAPAKARWHLPLFIILALYTGARKEAILSLRWPQVDLERGTIDFRRPGQAATKKGRAHARISRQLATFLRLAWRRRSSDLATVIEYQRRPIANVKRAFARAAAALPDVSPHTLKHTAITWLLLAGRPIWEVAGQTGTSEETIRRVYGHHAPDYLAGIADALSGPRRRSVPITAPKAPRGAR